MKGIFDRFATACQFKQLKTAGKLNLVQFTRPV